MSLRSTTTISPPPPPLPPYVEVKISPSILLIIVILAIIFFVSGLLHLLIRYLLKPPNSSSSDIDIDNNNNDISTSTTALQGQLQQLFHLHDAGVDQSFIDALPVFHYKAILGIKEDPFDCAVCLCEFEPSHKLRLLPNCSHAFHLPCIDTWLLTHSTCPLCRTSLLLSPSPSPTPPILLLLQSEPHNVNDHDNDDSSVVQIHLGKFRSLDEDVEKQEGACSSNLVGERRCFSMGTYEYVMNDKNPLKVAIEPTKKNESFSISKIWLRTTKPSEGGGGSCSLGLKEKNVNEMDGVDLEVGSMQGSQNVERVPSFARRTLLWIVGSSRHHNRVGSVS